MKTYRPSGKMGPTAIPFVLGGGLIASIVSGAVGSYVIQHIDLIIIWAALQGLIVGATIAGCAIQGHCRNRTFACLAAIIFALAAYAIRHHESYEIHRKETQRSLVTVLKQKYPNVTKLELQSTARELYDKRMQQISGRVDFIGWVIMTVNDGIAISQFDRRNDANSLGFYGSCVFLLVEYLIAIFSAFYLVYTMLSQIPYCEKCNVWIEGTDWVQPSTVSYIRSLDEQIEASQEGGELRPGALRYLPNRPFSGEYGVVELKTCKECGDGFLSTRLVIPGKQEGKFSFKELVRNAYLSSKALAVLVSHQ